MFSVKIEVRGKSLSDIEASIEEALQRITAGNVWGKDENSDGKFTFTVDGQDERDELLDHLRQVHKIDEADLVDSTIDPFEGHQAEHDGDHVLAFPHQHTATEQIGHHRRAAAEAAGLTINEGGAWPTPTLTD